MELGKPILGTVNMLGWRDMAYYHSDPWRGTWKGEGGGVLINQAPHQIDLLLWYMGEVEELYGLWDTLNHPELEVEDTAACVIRFKSGAIGNIVVSNSQNPALFGNVRGELPPSAFEPLLRANGYTESLSGQAILTPTAKGFSGTLTLPDGLRLTLFYDVNEQYSDSFAR